MDDRYRNDQQRGYYDRSQPQDYGQDYGSGRDYGYSSARDYAAAGASREEANERWRSRGRDDWGQPGRGSERDQRGGYGGSSYGGGSGYGSSGYGGGQSQSNANRGGNYGRGNDDRGDPNDRGFFERAGDEVRSWFGDEDAERRRERDQRYDDRQASSERYSGGAGDDHYHNWRRQRIAELDRDYDEYRQENATRFHNEFTSWRTERQGQRDSLRRVQEHMKVVGSDGASVGTVDKVRGDRIILAKGDAEASGRHHSIPSRWIQSVDGDTVTLRKTAEEAHSHWRDEERSAFFGSEDRDEGDAGSGHNLNRSFSGTY